MLPLQAADRDPDDGADRAGFRVGADVEAYEPAGCGRCSGSGYRGRIGLFSVMLMTDRIKEMTVEGAPEAELTRVAREEGMLTLREDGLIEGPQRRHLDRGSRARLALNFRLSTPRARCRWTLKLKGAGSGSRPPRQPPSRSNQKSTSDGITSPPGLVSPREVAAARIAQCCCDFQFAHP